MLKVAAEGQKAEQILLWYKKFADQIARITYECADPAAKRAL
mgnify:FL=1